MSGELITTNFIFTECMTEDKSKQLGYKQYSNIFFCRFLSNFTKLIPVNQIFVSLLRR